MHTWTPEQQHRGALVDIPIGKGITLDVGGPESQVRIVAESKSGGRVRLRVVAPPRVQIVRDEQVPPSV